MKDSVDSRKMIGTTVLLLIFMSISYFTGILSFKLVLISVIAATSFIIGSFINGINLGIIQIQKRLKEIWLSGIISGSIIFSAGVFVLPVAVSMDARSGSMGVVSGLILGYIIHHLSHQVFHAAESENELFIKLAGHTFIAGLIIAVIYTELPALSVAFGVSIVGHKLPAGMGFAYEITNKFETKVMVVASGVWIAILLVTVSGLTIPSTVQPVFFGVSAGLFIHAGFDLLPECVEQGADTRCSLDRQRRHSVLSIIAGCSLIYIVFLLM
jgi:ZIP family zinc transporter